jgi:hypothetical protein
MPEFTSFAALVRQAMPNHISEAQADAFARQPVTGEPGTTTWGQLFEETMSSRSAHIEGAANIYYSQNITADGHLVRSNEVAEALVEHSNYGDRITVTVHSIDCPCFGEHHVACAIVDRPVELSALSPQSGVAFD